MSRIGTVEQMNVVSVLQRIESFAKTGLLVIKQDTRWVELYCREGRLLCVGPIRTDATLGERLLQDRLISSQALQETMHVIGSAVPSETRIALTLMDLGYVKREELRAWASKKTEELLRVVLSWSTGDLYFNEASDPPAERLLVSLSISTLLASLSTLNVAQQAVPVTKHVVQKHVNVTKEPHTSPEFWDVSQTATLNDPSQFYAEPSSSQTPPTVISANVLLPATGLAINTGPIMPPPPQTPAPMLSIPTMTPPPTRRIDTSFLLPTMVLVPADLSMLSEQHLYVTQEQWRVLTRVDGHTSLQDVCNALNMRAEDVCRVVGHLMAEQIVDVAPPSAYETQEMSPASRNLVQSGLSNGLALPGYAAMTQSPWGSVLVSNEVLQPSPIAETQSQWGNGGNGATFVHGQGWRASSQSFQSPQANGFSNSNMYASAGGNH